MSRALPFTIGSYRVDEKLGAGGMGVVYKAVDTASARRHGQQRPIAPITTTS